METPVDGSFHKISAPTERFLSLTVSVDSHSLPAQITVLYACVECALDVHWLCIRSARGDTLSLAPPFLAFLASILLSWSRCSNKQARWCPNGCSTSMGNAIYPCSSECQSSLVCQTALVLTRMPTSDSAQLGYGTNCPEGIYVQLDDDDTHREHISLTHDQMPHSDPRPHPPSAQSGTASSLSTAVPFQAASFVLTLSSHRPIHSPHLKSSSHQH